MVSVSYTHLDVYKRQVIEIQRQIENFVLEKPLTIFKTKIFYDVILNVRCV